MKDDNVKKIEKLNVGDKIQKFNLFVIGTFLSALGFNLFISPYNIVTGGSTGIALIVKQYFNINISLFVLIINILFMILSFVLLGKRETEKSIIGSLLFPFFLTATYPFVKWIDLSQVNIVAIILYGGIITGFATGLKSIHFTKG